MTEMVETAAILHQSGQRSQLRDPGRDRPRHGHLSTAWLDRLGSRAEYLHEKQPLPAGCSPRTTTSWRALETKSWPHALQSVR
jgi:hypothetical protein